MTNKTDLEKTISLMSEHITSLQREFGHVVTKKGLIANSVSYQNNPEATTEVRKGIHALLEGSLLVYLFAMWESHMPDDVKEWLNRDENQSLDAYKHIRDSVAHKFNGERADFPNRRKAFEAEMPFSSVQWDQQNDTIDISDSSAALDCHSLMAELTKRLVVRFHSNKKP